MKTRKVLILGLATVALLALAGQSLACPVCFGDTDHPIIKGLEASVLFMVGITYSLIVGGFIIFLLLRRRARRLQEQASGTV